MSSENYLKKELYDLIKTDSKIFDFVQNSCLDGVWYWDLEQPENEWMNEKFWTTLGYDPEKMPHKSEAWQSIINQDDLNLALDNFNKHCEDPNHPYDQTVRYTHKNGSTVWIRCRGLAIRDDNNKPIRMLGAHHDVTDLKNAELELKKLNAEKDKFFSIIAHDMRSPLNGIHGLSNLLVEQIKENDQEGIDKYAEIIQHSSERAIELLTSLMDWSKTQMGRMQFNPEYFELTSFIEDIISQFQDIADLKSISVNIKTDTKVPIHADKAMMATIIRNLLSNALKFSYPKGNIEIKILSNPKEIEVSIKDEGVGIPKNKIDKLFRIDESFTTTGTQDEKGTGLGLILCKSFVNKHDGKIWVESEIGKGSNFSFTIPIKKEILKDH